MNMANAHHPVAVVQGIGELGRNFLREVGSVFWFIAHTFDESIGRIRRGRVPFRAASFFRHTERAGVESVPLVGLVSFFLGLTMALLTGYQLQRFGTERLIPGLVAIAFTRELGPLITGIMLAARIGAAFTAELGTMQVSEEVEAIEAMGIGPLRFLAAPRMLALFFLMPRSHVPLTSRLQCEVSFYWEKVRTLIDLFGLSLGLFRRHVADST